MPAALLVMIAASALPGFSQSNPDLQAFFQRNIGLSPGSDRRPSKADKSWSAKKSERSPGKRNIGCTRVIGS
jgi:hypothetical protein